MPKVEVDEADLIRDQRLRGLLEKVMAHPEARVHLEKAHKLIDPNAKTPTLDQQAQIKEPVSALEKKFDDFVAATNKRNEEDEAKRKRDELKSQVDSGLARLRSDGWTDEGIKAVEKIMEEKGILDPSIAAAWYEKQHPPAVPTTPVGGSWNFPEIPKDGGDTYEKALLESKGQNDLIAERQALSVLDDIRGATRRN